MCGAPLAPCQIDLCQFDIAPCSKLRLVRRVSENPGRARCTVEILEPDQVLNHEHCKSGVGLPQLLDRHLPIIGAPFLKSQYCPEPGCIVSLRIELQVALEALQCPIRFTACCECPVLVYQCVFFACTQGDRPLHYIDHFIEGACPHRGVSKEHVPQ